jgi:hypothetical protein
MIVPLLAASVAAGQEGDEVRRDEGWDLAGFVDRGADCELVAIAPGGPGGGARAFRRLATLPGSDCRGVTPAYRTASSLLVWFRSQNIDRSVAGHFGRSDPGFPLDEPAAPLPISDLEPDRAARLWLVELAGEPPFRARRLPLPEAAFGTIDSVLVDEAGRPVALTAAAANPVGHGARAALVFRGRRYRLPTPNATDAQTALRYEGRPVLVHALRFADGRWSPFETRASTWGADRSAGPWILRAFARYSENGLGLFDAALDGERVDDPALLARLAAATPTPGTAGIIPGTTSMHGDGAWWELRDSSGVLFDWTLTPEFSFTTGRLAWLTGDRYTPKAARQARPLEQLGFTDGDLVSLALCRGRLLVTRAFTGTHPRLYDLATGRLAWRADDVRAAMFWPTCPRKPE